MSRRPPCREAVRARRDAPRPRSAGALARRSPRAPPSRGNRASRRLDLRVPTSRIPSGRGDIPDSRARSGRIEAVALSAAETRLADRLELLYRTYGPETAPGDPISLVSRYAEPED